MRQQVYAHHAHRDSYKIVPRSPTYANDMSRAKFCLAPTGGGHGKRQVCCVAHTNSELFSMEIEKFDEWDIKQCGLQGVIWNKLLE